MQVGSMLCTNGLNAIKVTEMLLSVYWCMKQCIMYIYYMKRNVACLPHRW